MEIHLDSDLQLMEAAHRQPVAAEDLKGETEAQVEVEQHLHGVAQEVLMEQMEEQAQTEILGELDKAILQENSENLGQSYIQEEAEEAQIQLEVQVVWAAVVLPVMEVLRVHQEQRM